jgi:hypothetical protein
MSPSPADLAAILRTIYARFTTLFGLTKQEELVARALSGESENLISCFSRFLIDKDGNYIAPADIVDPSTSAVMIGTKARLLPLTNGFKIQVQNSSGAWIDQISYTQS